MVGKTYFLMKELARNGGGPSSSSFGTSLDAKLVAPAGFEMPEFPLQNFGELLTFERDLASREIFNHVQESLKSSCVASTSSSLTAMLTKFINETMSVALRCKRSLNKRKNQNSTLIVMSKETPNFLKMMKCTLQAGFNNSGKSLPKKDVNDAFTKFGAETNKH